MAKVTIEDGITVDIVYIVLRYKGTSKRDSTSSTIWKVYQNQQDAIDFCENLNKLEDDYYYTWENWVVR